MGVAPSVALYFTVDTEMPRSSVRGLDLALTNHSGLPRGPWSPSLLVKPASLQSLHPSRSFHLEALHLLVPLSARLSLTLPSSVRSVFTEHLLGAGSVLGARDVAVKKPSLVSALEVLIASRREKFDQCTRHGVGASTGGWRGPEEPPQ